MKCVKDKETRNKVFFSVVTVESFGSSMKLCSSYSRLLIVIFVAIIFKCNGDYTNCVLNHEDTYYDLTPLASQDYVLYQENVMHGDWNINYYFSFCHPLRNVPANCSDPNASVCIERVSKTTTLSGTPVSREIVVENAGQATPASLTRSYSGMLYYDFIDGSKCKNGENVETHIILTCANSEEEETGGLVPLTNRAGGCFHQFYWGTKHACSKKKEVPTISACSLKFKDSNDTLNLKQLHTESYYNITSKTTKLQMNICGNVNSDLCKGLNASVCDVTNPDNVKLISTTRSMELKRTGGLYSLLYNFNASLDRHGTIMKLKIDFICERSVHDIEFQVRSDSDTQIDIAARTSTVCTPKELECVFKDKNRKSYDLRKLHKTQGNYEAHDNRKNHRVS